MPPITATSYCWRVLEAKPQSLAPRAAREIELIHWRSHPIIPEHRTTAERRLRQQTLVVSSARLATLARGHGFERISAATSALPDDLLEAAGNALARHRL